MFPKLIRTKLFLILLPLLKFSAAQTWIKSGYWYSGSEYPVPDINSALFTHLVCAFAHINSSNYELSISSNDEPYVSTFTDIVKMKNPSVATLLSIFGGQENSSSFFSTVSQSSRRRSFIVSSIKLARSYGFQGLDLVNVNPSTPANMTNMGALLDEWRAAVNLECKSSNTPCLILTIGVYYSPVMDSMTYPVESIQKNLDWLHLRSFDYHLPPKDKYTGAHAALYDPLSRLNTDYGVKEWISKGLPANKLVLGLPYHGYAWTLLDPKDNSVGSPAKGLAITADGSMSYRYIKWYMNSYGVKSVFNSTYVVNYCTIGSFWIGFDDVEAIKAKVSYAKGKGLLGYNIWQVPNDDTNWVLSRAAENSDTYHQSKKHILLKILLPVATVIIILVLGIAMWYKRKQFRVLQERKAEGKMKLKLRNDNMTTIKNGDSHESQMFCFDEIEEATNNFSSENKLGEGGYGPVYKGKLRNGQEVAVKRLSESSKQGFEEFKNELLLNERVQHVNLLRVLGFCAEREEKMLIYEYMPNRSLDFYIYDPVRKYLLDWERRVDIIEGVTQGILYLQEYSRLKIVHRDLKPSNILLDNQLKPKISDFGLARIFQKDEFEANTGHVIGTYGYVPPEYVKKGIYSTKSDVFGFGVLLLQMISGRKNTCFYGPESNLNLLEYAYELWKDGRGKEFMDESLHDTSSSCKLITSMQIALRCVQEDPVDRPTMLEISQMLKNDQNITMKCPKRPAFSNKRDEDGEKMPVSSLGGTNLIDTATITTVVAR